MREPVSADLVLVGGGHAHVQVLRRIMMRPVPGVRLTVVLDRPEAVYSGMVPGFVAGDYSAADLEIDVVPLARRAGARVLLARALRVDPVARRIELEGRPDIAYDVACLDVGSTVLGLDLPGVAEHALATRPIGRFVERLAARLPSTSAGEAGEAVEAAEPLRVAVVGAGAAGVEIAFTLQARLRASGRVVEITIVSEAGEVLPGHPPRVVAAATRELAGRGLKLREGRVLAVEKDALHLDSSMLPCDLAIWATGPAPPVLLAASPLPLDAAGFVQVRSTLQVVGHDDLFAVGDCAALVEHPWVRRSGVYAVRQGPVVDANLRARLAGRSPAPYRPQRDFLMLLNLGERRALGAKWGVPARGAGVWRLKDWIDRRFMRRFQVLDPLDPSGAPAPDFPSPESMGMEEMPCGGCAAKVGASPLARALARLPEPTPDASVLLGLGTPDDAAALELPRGDIVLATVDAFRAFADDPWLVGRVAAVNAASDVFAKGGRPRHALALVNVPEEDPGRAEEVLYQVLAGIRAALDPLRISLVGGHTTVGEDLYVGLSISGDIPAASEIRGLAGLRPGDALILSRALGTGVLLAADMRGLARGRWVQAAYAAMLRPNEDAARIACAAGARACTDVSGFGLAGHLDEMLRASGVSAVLDAAALPAFEGALELLLRGVKSTAHEGNAAGRRAIAVDAALRDHPEVELLFDPQTSGGLLFGIPAERASSVVSALRTAGDGRAAVIGDVVEPRADGAWFAVSAGTR